MKVAPTLPVSALANTNAIILEATPNKVRLIIEDEVYILEAVQWKGLATLTLYREDQSGERLEEIR